MVSVSMTSWPNLTPLRSAPSVTPAAATITPPEASSVRSYFLSGSFTPMPAARLRFSSVSRMRRPCICPPMQRSAPAAGPPPAAAPLAWPPPAPAGGAAALLLGVEDGAALHLPADAAQRAGGEHALRGRADA